MAAKLTFNDEPEEVVDPEIVEPEPEVVDPEPEVIKPEPEPKEPTEPGDKTKKTWLPFDWKAAAATRATTPTKPTEPADTGKWEPFKWARSS